MSTDDLVRDVYRLFINRVDCYLGWHDRWVLKRRPVNQAMVRSALRGETALGVQAVSGSGTSRWTCMDVDDDRLLSAMFEVAKTVPADCRLLELSRRGGHLWIFHPATHWEAVHDQGVNLAERFGLHDIEVYPKHGGLHAVRLPGTKHPKSGIVYPAVDPESGELLDLPSILPTLSPHYAAPVTTPKSIRRQSRQRLFDEPTFDRLVTALTPMTDVKVYAPGRAAAVCPWHDDTHPSLYIKGRRFHCLACGVWGDEFDVRRWVTYGIRPPAV